MKRHIPNIITLSRIPMAVALPFVQSSPAIFWTLYLLCGLSDILDGAVARLTGTVSRLGERLDTLADIVFVAVWMVLFIPAINVGRWLWIWTGIIAFIKVPYIILVSLLATFATVQEGHLIRTESSSTHRS